MNKNKKLDPSNIDEVFTSNGNILKKSKPISLGIIVFLFILLVIVLIGLMFIADCFSINQATILGIIGSTCISFVVLLISLYHEKRDDYCEAKKSAKMLSQMLVSTDSQISRIENGTPLPITYPANWLEYYRSCSIYLKYDYLEYLLREFEIIDKINKFIEENNTEKIFEILQYRKKSITDWTSDFNILSVRLNLSFFSLGADEIKPWKQEKKYIEFKNFFIENYIDKVKELTIKFLKENGNSCDVDEAQYYVMREIRNEAALISGKYKYEAMENKKMLSVIFKIYLSLKKEDKFTLCWGVLTLKDN